MTAFQKTNKNIDDVMPVLQYVKSIYGYDFSGCRPEMLRRRVHKRVMDTNCPDICQYLEYLKSNSGEKEHLLETLTIKVSYFFREPLVFDYIGEKMIPDIVDSKKAFHDSSLRVWSSGCAGGEEPYSVAILIRELIERKKLSINLNIFATDIDEIALQKAKKGVYDFDSVKNTRYAFIKKYFKVEDEKYFLAPEVKNMVTFSLYDMLDRKSFAPPESIFGNFDIILCMNLLIYFNPVYQETMFKKLYRSLASDGYLILGRTEELPKKYHKYFTVICKDLGKIYQKK